MNFHTEPQEVALPVSQGTWGKVLDSADPRWDGPGAMPLATAAGRQRVTMPPRTIAVFQTSGPGAEQAAVEEALTLIKDNG
ncbi:MAG: DUF3459 domain-containing protein [Planctomycetes bacterium]|nr:DUF3459 domain-containing protein [Planctomycetota bacterium]